LAPTNKLKNKTSSLCGSMCNFLIYLVVPQWCYFLWEKIIFLFLWDKIIGRGSGPSFKRRKTDRVWSMHVACWRLWLWRFAPSTVSCHIVGLVCNWPYHFICWYCFLKPRSQLAGGWDSNNEWLGA
jgi:hypothetical protein